MFTGRSLSLNFEPLNLRTVFLVRKTMADKIKFIYKATCTTCRKARSFLQAKKVSFEEREYGKNPLAEKELREIVGEGPIENFLNTRTPLYREGNMKQKLTSKAEAIKLMLKDLNLLKRPVIIKGKKKLTGFNEAEVKELL